MSTATVSAGKTESIPQNAHLQPKKVNSPIEVSVCIVNWNCRDLLRACLNSLREDLQKTRLEVIVVDNASTDGAAEMVAREFPEVILIQNAVNQGFSIANNQAARLARGEYLFFLNNDTLVPPSSLCGLLKFAENNPDVGLIGPRLIGADGNYQVSYRCKPTVRTLLNRTLLFRWIGLFRKDYLRYRRREFDPSKPRKVDILMGAALFTNRKKFLSWGGWDEDFTFGGEDLELSTRIGSQAPLVYWPEVEIVHHGRVSTRRHIAFASTQIAVGMLRYLRKSGVAPWKLWIYKLAIILDTPILILAKTVEFIWRLIRNRREKARKSLLGVKAGWHFLTSGLIDFLRA